MKHEEMIVLGLAALAVFFIMKGSTKGGSSGTPNAAAFVTKAAPDYQGWQYFSDGTAISPDGAYYHNGVQVWAP